jgi:hypothetical protein
MPSFLPLPTEEGLVMKTIERINTSLVAHPLPLCRNVLRAERPLLRSLQDSE